MKKSYIIKIYDSAGVYITTLNEKLRLSKIGFRETINGGQGGLSLSIKSEFVSPPSWAELNNFAKIYVVKVVDGVQSESLLFTGMITQVRNTLQGSTEYLTLSILALSSLLGLALYKEGSSFDVVKSSVDPADIATDIISKVNSSIGGSWFSTGANVVNVGTNVSYTFKKKNWLNAMGIALKLSDSNYYWWIGADGELYFKESSATPDHKFNIATNVNKIDVVSSSEKIINESTIKTSSATQTANDATSIADYFKRDEYREDNDADSSAGQQFVDYEVATKKEPKLKVKVTINSTYDIESIRPGQTCKFFGLKLGSTTLGENMLIVGVNYKETEVDLTLDDEFANFGSELSGFFEEQLLERQL